ncbi:hypothetical protein CSB45_11735 [candidate division KSB3 bacterium]|uniref:Uncharacterized protein n=1 Tax=candidate division KSB3 bacterium TaxID=2044937 RepID=A0A2G6E317_9BACT|nr:MAG: hypothetical protein CSB45_11735 [candidate division KSB3 bacterium]PIE29274.1 MAG: hypothetical protein CSA57_09715 [candidate division KSB3 bacterium]
MDKITLFISQAINTLMLGRPVKTALGLVCGLCIHSFSIMFKSVLEGFSWLSGDIPMLNCLGLGLGLLYLPDIILNFVARDRFSENIREIFDMLEDAKKRGILSERKLNELGLETCRKVIANVSTHQVVISKDEAELKISGKQRKCQLN